MLRKQPRTAKQRRERAMEGRMLPATPGGLQIVRERERQQMMGISRVTMWRLEQEGKAPKRVQIGENSVGWLRHEIEAWIKGKAAAR